MAHFTSGLSLFVMSLVGFLRRCGGGWGFVGLRTMHISIYLDFIFIMQSENVADVLRMGALAMCVWVRPPPSVGILSSEYPETAGVCIVLAEPLTQSMVLFTAAELSRCPVGPIHTWTHQPPVTLENAGTYLSSVSAVSKLLPMGHVSLLLVLI